MTNEAQVSARLRRELSATLDLQNTGFRAPDVVPLLLRSLATHVVEAHVAHHTLFHLWVTGALSVQAYVSIVHARNFGNHCLSELLTPRTANVGTSLTCSAESYLTLVRELLDAVDAPPLHDTFAPLAFVVNLSPADATHVVTTATLTPQRATKWACALLSWLRDASCMDAVLLVLDILSPDWSDEDLATATAKCIISIPSGRKCGNTVAKTCDTQSDVRTNAAATSSASAADVAPRQTLAQRVDLFFAVYNHEHRGVALGLYRQDPDLFTKALFRRSPDLAAAVFINVFEAVYSENIARPLEAFPDDFALFQAVWDELKTNRNFQLWASSVLGVRRLVAQSLPFALQVLVTCARADCPLTFGRVVLALCDVMMENPGNDACDEALELFIPKLQQCDVDFLNDCLPETGLPSSLAACAAAIGRDLTSLEWRLSALIDTPVDMLSFARLFPRVLSVWPPRRVAEVICKVAPLAESWDCSGLAPEEHSGLSEVVEVVLSSILRQFALDENPQRLVSIAIYCMKKCIYDERHQVLSAENKDGLCRLWNRWLKNAKVFKLDLDSAHVLAHALSRYTFSSQRIAFSSSLKKTSGHALGNWRSLPVPLTRADSSQKDIKTGALVSRPSFGKRTRATEWSSRGKK